MSSRNNMPDVDQAVRQHLAQYVHVRCGGQPVTLPDKQAIGCSLCKFRAEWTGKLGDAMAKLVKSGDFRSMVVE